MRGKKRSDPFYCKKCDKSLTRDDFYWGSNGCRVTYCKPCYIQHKKNLESNRVEVFLKNGDWYKADSPDGSLVCIKCNKSELSPKDFPFTDASRKHVRSDCRQCAYDKTAHKRNTTRVTGQRYGTTNEILTAICSETSLCQICEKTAKAARSLSERLCIDHNSATGFIRGLLCHHCNSGIGQFFDNQELMLRAVQYLIDTGSWDLRNLSLLDLSTEKTKERLNKKYFLGIKEDKNEIPHFFIEKSESGLKFKTMTAI